MYNSEDFILIDIFMRIIKWGKKKWIQNLFFFRVNHTTIPREARMINRVGNEPDSDIPVGVALTSAENSLSPIALIAVTT